MSVFILDRFRHFFLLFVQFVLFVTGSLFVFIFSCGKDLLIYICEYSLNKLNMKFFRFLIIFTMYTHL